MNNSTPGRKIAVFDVDETLIAKTSAEIRFIKFLLDKKVLSYSKLLRSIGRPLWRLTSGWERAILWKSYYLRGIKLETIVHLLPEFYEKEIYPRVFKPLADAIPLFKEHGYSIYLLSGTLNIFIPELVKLFGADDGTGSEMEVVNGEFTGFILGTHPYYTGKISVLKKMLGDAPIDYARSYTFGDSFADRPLMTLFGHPYAVHPGRRLHKIARKLRWEVVDNTFSAERDLHFDD